ncbi:MAG: hypothetical protein ABJA67_00585 [Chthonomonadales bacterium]
MPITIDVMWLKTELPRPGEIIKAFISALPVDMARDRSLLTMESSVAWGVEVSPNADLKLYNTYVINYDGMGLVNFMLFEVDNPEIYGEVEEPLRSLLEQFEGNFANNEFNSLISNWENCGGIEFSVEHERGSANWTWNTFLYFLAALAKLGNGYAFGELGNISHLPYGLYGPNELFAAAESYVFGN